MKMEERPVAISTETIKLEQLLELAGTDTGGQAKLLIQEKCWSMEVRSAAGAGLRWRT